MCGIWARVLFDKKVSLDELVDPVRFLSHRGPDGFGWYLKDNVALVHTRLSIIDITQGSQPLQSHDERLWGVINGELYDYKLIRSKLLSEGVKFNTESDSEVLLNLFAQSGATSFANISGEYSFIFYDEKIRKLYFGRDPHGVKPLFYELNHHGLTLSSEMKAISNSVPELDEEYQKLFIGRMMIPPKTALKNILHVLPGRLYVLDLNTKKLSWQIFQSLPLPKKRELTRNQVLEEIELELEASVKRRLVADVEVGCYLSGGIDSALIAAMAVKSGAKPRAFTVGFSDRDLDESSRAASIAKFLGIKHSVVMMSGKNFIPSLIKSIVAFENPVANPHGAAKNLLAQHASASVKVVLSGEGADEWCGGYAYFRIKKLDKFLRRHPTFSRQILENYVNKELVINMHSLDGKSTTNDGLVKSHFEGKIPALFGRAMEHGMFNHLTDSSLTDYLHKACRDLRGYFDEDFGGKLSESSDWDINSWTAIRTDLLHYILGNVGDRQEMAHSLEGRTPFLDPNLTRVFAAVPEKYHIHGLTEKWALREVAKKYLPQNVTSQHKHPFFAPMKYLYLKDSREQMNSYIETAKAHSSWLNWKNIEALLAEEQLGTSSSFEGTIISLKLILFSMGVLVKELRNPHVPAVRGYELPTEAQHLTPYRKGI